jgi:hypothetical protein
MEEGIYFGALGVGGDIKSWALRMGCDKCRERAGGGRGGGHVGWVRWRWGGG